jgi:short-subunit dehydrogenase
MAITQKAAIITGASRGIGEVLHVDGGAHVGKW